MQADYKSTLHRSTPIGSNAVSTAVSTTATSPSLSSNNFINKQINTINNSNGITVEDLSNSIHVKPNGLYPSYTNCSSSTNNNCSNSSNRRSSSNYSSSNNNRSCNRSSSSIVNKKNGSSNNSDEGYSRYKQLGYSTIMNQSVISSSPKTYIRSLLPYPSLNNTNKGEREYIKTNTERNNPSVSSISYDNRRVNLNNLSGCAYTSINNPSIPLYSSHLNTPSISKDISIDSSLRERDISTHIPSLSPSYEDYILHANTNRNNPANSTVKNNNIDSYRHDNVSIKSNRIATRSISTLPVSVKSNSNTNQDQLHSSVHLSSHNTLSNTSLSPPPIHNSSCLSFNRRNVMQLPSNSKLSTSNYHCPSSSSSALHMNNKSTEMQPSSSPNTSLLFNTLALNASLLNTSSSNTSSSNASSSSALLSNMSRDKLLMSDKCMDNSKLMDRCKKVISDKYVGNNSELELRENSDSKLRCTYTPATLSNISSNSTVPVTDRVKAFINYLNELYKDLELVPASSVVDCIATLASYSYGLPVSDTPWCCIADREIDINSSNSICLKDRVILKLLNTFFRSHLLSCVQLDSNHISKNTEDSSLHSFDNPTILSISLNSSNRIRVSLQLANDSGSSIDATNADKVKNYTLIPLASCSALALALSAVYTPQNAELQYSDISSKRGNCKDHLSFSSAVRWLLEELLSRIQNSLPFDICMTLLACDCLSPNLCNEKEYMTAISTISNLSDWINYYHKDLSAFLLVSLSSHLHHSSHLSLTLSLLHLSSNSLSDMSAVGLAAWLRACACMHLSYLDHPHLFSQCMHAVNNIFYQLPLGVLLTDVLWAITLCGLPSIHLFFIAVNPIKCNIHLFNFDDLAMLACCYGLQIAGFHGINHNCNNYYINSNDYVNIYNYNKYNYVHNRNNTVKNYIDNRNKMANINNNTMANIINIPASNNYMSNVNDIPSANNISNMNNCISNKSNLRNNKYAIGGDSNIHLPYEFMNRNSDIQAYCLLAVVKLADTGCIPVLGDSVNTDDNFEDSMNTSKYKADGKEVECDVNKYMIERQVDMLNMLLNICRENKSSLSRSACKLIDFAERIACNTPSISGVRTLHSDSKHMSLSSLSHTDRISSTHSPSRLPMDRKNKGYDLQALARSEYSEGDACSNSSSDKITSDSLYHSPSSSGSDTNDKQSSDVNNNNENDGTDTVWWGDVCVEEREGIVNISMHANRYNYLFRFITFFKSITSFIFMSSFSSFLAVVFSGYLVIVLGLYACNYFS